jgi:exosome complex component RRP42
MAPAVQLLLSPAELSFLRTSLALNPPIRPDGRSPTEFRPLIAEKDVVPSANGSARVCFADGTEAIVGIKAQVEKSDTRYDAERLQDIAMNVDADNDELGTAKGQGESEWVEMSIDIPGCRDDDALPIFLSNLLMEALLAGGEVQNRLWINRRFHWKLYIDVRLPIRRCTLAHTRLDSPALCSAVVSSSAPLHCHTLGVAHHTVAKARLRRRSRPSLR